MSGARPSAWTAADERAVAQLMVVVVALRVATALAAFFVNVSFPLVRPEQFTMLGVTDPFWDAFVRNDSGWYFGIASRGYEWVAGGRNNLAFFPAYPLLMGAVGRLFGGTQADFYFAGIVISWVSSVASAGFVFGYARQHLEGEAAWHATLLTYVFPFAFFFGTVYAEALFLLGLSGALFALSTRRWGLAVVAGVLMTATRVNGIMAVPALMWVGWHSAGDGGRVRLRGVAAGGAASLGFLAYCAYNYAITGDWFEWYHAITRWGYQPGSTLAGNPLVAFVGNLATRPYAYLVEEHAAPYDVLNGLFPLAMIAALPWVWRRLGGGAALLIAANLALRSAPDSSRVWADIRPYCSRFRSGWPPPRPRPCGR